MLVSPRTLSSRWKPLTKGSLANTRRHLIDDVTEGEILRELDIWKSLANVISQENGIMIHHRALYLRHLRVCQQGVEGVVLSDHLFGGQVLGSVLPKEIWSVHDSQSPVLLR